MLKRLGQAWGLRPLGCAALGLCVGLGLGRVWLLGLASALTWLGALVAGLLSAWTLWRSRDHALAWALLGLGLAAGLLRVHGLAQALAAPGGDDLRALRLQGTIAADDGPRPLTHRHLYVLKDVQVQALRDKAAPWQPWPAKLRASLDEWEAVDLGLLPGDRVQIYGDLHAVEGPSNPGEFDYRSYLLGKGIQGSFSAKKGWLSSRLAEGAWYLPLRLAGRAQAWMGRGLAAGLAGRWLDLGRGIVLGDKSGLAREDLAEYSRSGLADLLAVSGTHFTLALGLVLLLARWVTASKRWQAALGLALGLAYALVTGFEAPVQRAFALFALWLVGRILDLDTELPTSLAAGALAILLAQPGALWEPGFQLSFLTTLAVCTVGPALGRELPIAWPHWLRLGLAALLAAQMALVPLLAYHFHQFCWPALFASIVSGTFTFAILALGLPLALLGTWLPGAGLVLGWPLTWTLRALDWVSAFSAALPGSAFSTGVVPALLLAGFVAWALLALFWRSSHKGAGLAGLGLVLVSGLLWPGLPWMHQHAGLTKMWCLDIGQGDSTLLEFEDGRTLLVDAGPAKPDAGAWVVVPALRALGIQRLTWALATHADADHVGGLAWVLGQFPVGVLLWNGQEVQSGPWVAVQMQAELHHVPLRALNAALPNLEEDGPWQVLNPAPARRPKKAPKKPDTNAASVVLRVEDWLLLTGDFPKKGEARLVKQGLKSVQVLKVGHHGSRTSTSPAFVRALDPEVALISCGRHNYYGHPHALALAALKGRDLDRTDLEGCLYLEHHQDGKLSIRPWWDADPASLWQPRLRPPSPWRGLKLDADDED